MDEHTERRIHKLSMINREVGSLTGVREVKAFNDSEILLDTDMGILSIQGTGLHVTKLNLEKGEVEIDGTIDRFLYTNPKGTTESGGFFGKLFR